MKHLRSASRITPPPAPLMPADIHTLANAAAHALLERLLALNHCLDGPLTQYASAPGLLQAVVTVAPHRRLVLAPDAAAELLRRIESLGVPKL